MYSGVDIFKIVDVNKVVLSSPNTIEIPEPVDFKTMELFVEKDPEDRGGANFEFGDAESQLGFDMWDQAYQTIEAIIDASGSDATILLEYYQLIDGVEVRRYQGDILASTMDQEDDLMRFRVKRLDFGNKFQTRFSIENSIESSEDLSGETIPKLDLLSIPMHSKKILAEGVLNVLDSPLFEDLTFSPGANYDPGLLWCTPTFNIIEKELVNLFQQTDFYGLAGSPSTDQERYASQNVLVQNSQYMYKATALEDVVSLNMKHVFTIELDTKGVTGGGTVGDFDEIRSRRLTIWVVNKGVFKEVIHEFFEVFLDVSYDNPTISESYATTLNLVKDDEVYYALDYATGGTVNSVNVRYVTRSTKSDEGFFIMTSISTEQATDCKGHYIYEALNKLIQNAVGSTGITEVVLNLDPLPGSWAAGQTIRGVTSNATGTYYDSPGVNQARLINVEGAFKALEGVTNEIDAALLTNVEPGQILKSSLLERVEQGAVSDGCGSLNFISNGFAVRDFINKEYDAERYYRAGNKVSYLDTDYEYINEAVENGNLPTDTDYWKLQDGRQVTSSIEKILSFVKFRYGAGIAIVKEPGAGYGVETFEKVTRVLIEKSEHFFQDKKIMTLENLADPVIKRMNSLLVHNEYQFGYSEFGEPDNEGSLAGFNTIRKYISPIEKTRAKFPMVADVITDGFEIERLRRLKFNAAPNDSDPKDDSTFVVKCLRYNSANPFKSEELTEGGLSYVDKSNGIFGLQGLNIGTKIDEVSTFTYAGLGTFTIDQIVYDSEKDMTSIKTNDAVPGSGISIQAYEVYFDIDIIQPQRAQGFSEVSGVLEEQTEYNIDHAPTNFLIENFPWFGSGLRAKDGDEKIRFTSGKHNIFFTKKYDSNSCFPNADFAVAENDNFTLTNLRTWNPEIFTDFEYEVSCHMTYLEYERFREALLLESDEDINGGFVDFTFRGSTIEAFPFQLRYNPQQSKVGLILWGKK
jgi:hypothetical protein